MPVYAMLNAFVKCEYLISTSSLQSARAPFWRMLTFISSHQALSTSLRTIPTSLQVRILRQPIHSLPLTFFSHKSFHRVHHYKRMTAVKVKETLTSRFLYTKTTRKLPRLPVPSLQKTMARYLDSVRPILPEDHYKKTEEEVKKFLESPGPELQYRLENLGDSFTNWLAFFQDDKLFLDNREPLAIMHNFPFIFPDKIYDTPEQLLRHAAKTITAYLEMKDDIESGAFEVQNYKGIEMDMRLYGLSYSACRVPGIKRDAHVCYPFTDQTIRHILVFHNKQMFSLDVYAESGERLNIEQLYKQLTAITEQSPNAGEPVTLLTALDRESWAEIYDGLREDEENRAVFDTIHRALFVVCLDQTSDVKKCSAYDDKYDLKSNPAIIDTEMLSHSIEQMYHGGGVSENFANRWYDKPLNLIFKPGFNVGALAEHYAMDGMHVCHTMNTIRKHINAMDKREDGKEAPNLTPPTKLELKLNDEARKGMETAEKNMTKLVENSQMRAFNFICYGKGFMKQNGINPDGFMQVALHLTYYRIYKKPVVSSEYVSLQMYQLGRTTVHRSNTDACKAFYESMDDKNVSDADKVRLMAKAADLHRAGVRETVADGGVQMHMMALAYMAQEKGMPTPDIFLDPAYEFCSDFIVETAHVTVPEGEYILACGPYNAHSYVFIYMLEEEMIRMTIGAWKDPEKGANSLDVDRFAHVLIQTLNDMHTLVSSHASSAKGPKILDLHLWLKKLRGR